MPLTIATISPRYDRTISFQRGKCIVSGKYGVYASECNGRTVASAGAEAPAKSTAIGVDLIEEEVSNAVVCGEQMSNGERGEQALTATKAILLLITKDTMSEVAKAGVLCAILLASLFPHETTMSLLHAVNAVSLAARLVKLLLMVFQ